MRREYPRDMSTDPFKANRGYNPEFLRRVRAKRAQAQRMATIEREKRIASTRQTVKLDAPTWVKMIIADCCRKRAIPADQALRKHVRTPHILACRREIFWRLRNSYFRPSYPRIAGWFGLDHTTVMHAVRKYEQRHQSEAA